MLGLHSKNPRLLSLVFLGFSSGLPLALTGSTLQAWFTQSGISLVAIGALSLIGIPYVWKFLWAPLMDRFVPPLWGRRRGWIAITQLGLCVLLFIMASMDPHMHAGMIGFVAVLIAFMSASQDIAIDAYRTDILLPDERGLGMATFIFAFRIAMLCSGGLALIFADHMGWRFTYELMAVLMALSIIPTYLAPESSRLLEQPVSLYATVTESFKQLLQRDAIVLTLIFIVLYKMGDALVVALTSNFLLRGLGFTLTDVGLAYKTVGLIATIIGAFVGGGLLARIGLYRGLWVFGVAQACSNFMFMILAMVGKNYALMVSAIFIENFCAGMSTIALMAFLTSLCHERYSATQFACLSALAAIGRVFVGPLAGIMVEHLGWVSFYGWASLMCFPAIIVLSLLRTRMSFNAEAIA
jgi:PAT family beta-lactamase induction signal transducer AmpG